MALVWVRSGRHSLTYTGMPSLATELSESNIER